MRKCVTFLVITVLLLAVLWAAKDALAEFFLTRLVRRTTGFVITVDRVDVGLMNASLQIEGVKVFNPASIRDTFVADVPLIYFDCELFDLFRGTIYLRDLKIHINELVMVKNEAGLSNLEAFAGVFASSETPELEEKFPSVPGRVIESVPQLKIGIFEFVLKKIVYKRYSSDGDPRTFEITANYRQRLTNVTSIGGLLRPLGFLAVNKLIPLSGSVAAQSDSGKKAPASPDVSSPETENPGVPQPKEALLSSEQDGAGDPSGGKTE